MSGGGRLPRGYGLLLAVALLALLVVLLVLVRGRPVGLIALLGVIALIAVADLIAFNFHKARRDSIALRPAGRRCPQCWGRGLVPESDWLPLLLFGIVLGSLLRREETCPTCGGTGRMIP